MRMKLLLKKIVKLSLRMMLLQNPMLRKKTMPKKTRKKLLQMLPHGAPPQPVLSLAAFSAAAIRRPRPALRRAESFPQFSTGAGT